MSFRTRLTSFFVLIVVVPMIGVGLLVFRLISDSQTGKADARASGLATSAQSVYLSAAATARADAGTIARNPTLRPGPGLQPRLAALLGRAGVTRITVSRGRHVITDVGDSTAIAPGAATITPGPARAPLTVTVSTLTAGDYVRNLAARGVVIVVGEAGRTLAATTPAAGRASLPARRGTADLAGVSYRAVPQSFQGFGGERINVTVLSSLSATSRSLGTSQIVAAVFILAFLLLAFSFSILASRALEGQLGRFLNAARRLGGGDFSAPVPIEGSDEFAELGLEFNKMSSQLANRLYELDQERGRLRESIHRIGQTFASNLDRPALMKLALGASLDAVQGECGRLSARVRSDEPLAESFRLGQLAGLDAQFLYAERAALRSRDLGESSGGETSVASIALGPLEPGGPAQGLITVGRRGKPFTDADRDLLRSLAAQATLALENVELHVQVQRQAVTDELTGLDNHGRFQQILSAELEQVRRYHHPVGLIMIDIDDFKSVNDTYGHPQGDIVLKQVARVLRDSSREADAPARYGGEEMALILPHTDLEGSYAIAERVRTAIEALRVPRLDQQGVLRVTASLGVAATADGFKEDLIADADTALYAAKRHGKNRTIRAPFATANVSGGE
ncbi:MAG: diguanylate cyclase [Actinomycetota bacterium]|nr:diguanylate cyclase [Actinomycetota bacterium]